MARADRAVQFAPFAALKGYEEALRAKEYNPVPKASLTEEALEYLDYKLNQVTRGNVVTVVYYNGYEYEKKIGMVAKIDKEKRILTVVNEEISFDDIHDIDI